MENFKHIVNPGRGKFGEVYCTIKYKDERLSITGVVGPYGNGNCEGGCGQIVNHLSEDCKELSTFWDITNLDIFVDVWNKWHLNDIRSNCAHQRMRGETWSNNPGVICPECKYKLGNAWLFEAVPENVLEWLYNLPQSDKLPKIWH